MATARKRNPKLGIGSVLVEPELPSAAQMHDVIERWRAAKHLADVARQAEDECRREMVAMLKAAGLTGFVL